MTCWHRFTSASLCSARRWPSSAANPLPVGAAAKRRARTTIAVLLRTPGATNSPGQQDGAGRAAVRHALGKARGRSLSNIVVFLTAKEGSGQSCHARAVTDLAVVGDKGRSLTVSVFPRGHSVKVTWVSFSLLHWDHAGAAAPMRRCRATLYGEARTAGPQRFLLAAPVVHTHPEG